MPGIKRNNYYANTVVFIIGVSLTSYYTYSYMAYNYTYVNITRYMRNACPQAAKHTQQSGQYTLYITTVRIYVVFNITCDLCVQIRQSI